MRESATTTTSSLCEKLLHKPTYHHQPGSGVFPYEENLPLDTRAKSWHTSLVMNTSTTTDVDSVPVEDTEPLSSGEGNLDPGTDHPVEEGEPLPDNLKTLSRKQERIIRYIAMGFDNQVIAELVGVTWRYVGILRRQPRIKERVEMYRELQRAQAMDNITKLDELVPKALEQMEKMLTSKKTAASVKEKVVAQVLDRHPSGQYVRQRKQQTEIKRSLDNSAIDELKRIAAKNMAEAIDVTCSSHEQCEDLNRSGDTAAPLPAGTLRTPAGPEEETFPPSHNDTPPPGRPPIDDDGGDGDGD